MVGRPRNSLRLLMEYDDKNSTNKKNTEYHHEKIPSVQKTFLCQVKGVTDVIKGLGNPFADISADLLQLIPN